MTPSYLLYTVVLCVLRKRDWPKKAIILCRQCRTIRRLSWPRRPLGPMLDLLLIIRSCIKSVGGQREVQEVRKTSGHIESFVLSSVFWQRQCRTARRLSWPRGPLDPLLDLLLIIRACIESAGGPREVQEVRKTSEHIERFVLSIYSVLVNICSWTD